MTDKIKFKICSTCKEKIGFFRRKKAVKQDKSGKFPITQQQFCSSKCATIGYHIYLEFQDVKRRERIRAGKIIDTALENISKKRVNMIHKYGSIDRVPPHELPLLYSGAYKLLEIIKEQIQHGDEKKTN